MTDPQLVPSVVSVMVVHQPGDWFDETLEALAEQDYPNLRTLFLVTATDDDELLEFTERIRHFIPTAFVRPKGERRNGPAVNEALRLVEGDNGFFPICHDDVVAWGDPADGRRTVPFERRPRRAQARRMGPAAQAAARRARLDRFGEVDPIIDPGEVDQEQHDAVRCVHPVGMRPGPRRLFRALGGFDLSMSFYGEDVDLCWRFFHPTGA